MRNFQGVSLSLPAGPSAYQDKNNWQSAAWVHWSKGDLRIDAASFAIIFSPSGCKGLTAKPFGCLTSASVVPPVEPGGLSEFVACTNDSVHGLIRLEFQSLADEQAFCSIAQAAELSCSGRHSSSRGPRSSISGRRSSICTGASGDGISESMRSRIDQQFLGSCPLIHGSAELYGPDPSGYAGSEVLLGQGAVVFLDSQEAGRVGNYELLFFDEAYIAPMLRTAISPRLLLTRLSGGADEGEATRTSTRRQSMSMDNMRPSFELSMPGGGPWGLVFDLEEDAAAFTRDYLVRQRLVTLSLKTSKGWRTVHELQGELVDIRRRSVFATAQRFLHRGLALVAISLLAYIGILYANDPQRALPDIAFSAIGDAASAGLSALGWASEAGSVVCGLLVPSLPASELRRCLALPDASETRDCAAMLLGGSWA